MLLTRDKHLLPLAGVDCGGKTCPVKNKNKKKHTHRGPAADESLAVGVS